MPQNKKEGIKVADTNISYGKNKQLYHLISLEEKMIENMNSLQKVQVQIAEKFDKLTNQLSDLLSLFESAAQTFAQDPLHQITDKDREFLEKVNQLIEQNKTIAKALTLMEEKLREKTQSYAPHYLARTPQKETPAQTREQKTTEETEYKEPPVQSSSRPLPKF